MAKQNRQRRPDRALTRVSDPAPADVSRRDRAAVAWCGALFVVVAVVGLELWPVARPVWIVFLIFGAATVPQIAVWWLEGLKRRR